MNCKGFTLVEALVAISIMGIALAGIVPSFLHNMDTNTSSEQHSDAVAVAQEVLEQLRHEDPTLMQSSGSSDVQVIAVGGRDYEVINSYCTNSDYCTSGSRHIVVEVSFAGRIIYELETVYTQLQ
jgi:prepilin-type N-terminal cleavage/methylation domain-containing protein